MYGLSASTGSGLVQCKDHLKSCYLNRPMEPTRWSKLGGPALYFDIAIIKSRCLEDRFREEHAMGLVKDKMDYVTVDDILTAGHQKIILIEGDPGAGKTTITVNICKRWSEGELLTNELMFLVPLRDKYYQKVTNLNELFDALKCSVLTEYAEQNYGKGLVFILDGWDELPDHLQSQSFFHDIIFKKSALTCSTVIVTSRPSCSDHIAEVVQDHYYQILGFTPQTVKIYIREYFKDNSQSVSSLLEILIVREYLCQHFHIPITAVIMCFVYHKSGNQLPETLSKLYEKFVLLCVRCNVPESLKRKFKSLHNIPEELHPLFSKLCKIALRMLINKTVVFDGEELEYELKQLHFTSIDVFGLLSAEHVTNELAEKEIHYSFIHRAVQELLAAMSILESNSIEDTIDKHFHEGSYLINVFPFVFGLMSKVMLRPLGNILRQKFIQSDRSDKLLTTILYCLFEAQDEILCCEFGQVFSEKNDVKLSLRSDLEYRYAAYFLSVYGCKQLNVNVTGLFLTDTRVEVMGQYLCNTLTEIISFNCEYVNLSERGIKVMDKILIYQQNFSSLKIRMFIVPSPSCVKIMCDTICKYNLSITKLELLDGTMSKDDLDSLGCLIITLKSLECLSIRCSYVEGVSLNSSDSFSNALCNTKSLKEFEFGINSYDDSKMISNILSQNSSLTTLHMHDVKNADHLIIIFDGLSSNKTVTRFITHPSCVCGSITFGQSIEKCIASNQSLTRIDFTDLFSASSMKGNMWSSSQVCSICTGLQFNNTLVTLNISGCYIDKTASDAVCVMLSLNTSLHRLFLNPVHMEKPEAVAIIDTCNTNTTLEVLSLAKWPDNVDEIGKIWDKTWKFAFSTDQEIDYILDQVQKSRQDKKRPILKVIWLVSVPYMLCCYGFCLCRKYEEYYTRKILSRH